MAVSQRVKRLTNETKNPNSLSGRYRAKRWEQFRAAFPDLERMQVLDLGETPAFWRRGAVRPLRVTTVNMADKAATEPWIRHIVGDACAVPPEARGHYDLVFSNSVIEHVGGHANRQRLADNVHAFAAAHWVQTPNRYFPVEPHWFFPGFQFLPVPARVTVSQRWPLGHSPRGGAYAQHLELVLSIDLIGRVELASLFPDSQIVRERVGPFAKSLIAFRAAC